MQVTIKDFHHLPSNPFGICNVEVCKPPSGCFESEIGTEEKPNIVCSCSSFAVLQFDCNYPSILEYPHHFLRILGALIVDVFVFVVVILTLVHRLRTEKWKANLSNVLYISLFFQCIGKEVIMSWLTTLVLILRECFDSQTKANPGWYTLFNVVSTINGDICVAFTVNFWMNLYLLFRGNHSQTPRIVVKSIIGGYLLVQVIRVYALGVNVYYGFIDDWATFDLDKYAPVNLLLFTITTIIIFNFGIIMMGVETILVFRKHNISGNLPIAKISTLCIGIGALYIGYILPLLLTNFPPRPSFTMHNNKYHVRWAYDIVYTLFIFIELVAARGGSILDVFKPSTWKNSSTGTENMVTSTTVTVSTSASQITTSSHSASISTLSTSA